MNRCLLALLFPLILLVGITPAVSFDVTIPDTGQDLCYDWERVMCDEWHLEGYNQVCDSEPYCPSEGEDFYGQDGSYSIHPPDLTLMDNATADGRVRDNVTGLMWEQKTLENEPMLHTFDDAVAYCEDLSLGGYSDWRMPTRKEYSTLLNSGRVSPALDTDYFPYYTTEEQDAFYYWTASAYHDDPQQVWTMLLAFGLIDKKPTTGRHKVRCVRGDTEPGASYTDNEDGTVTDNVTGLMWQQKTTDEKDVTYTWKDALAYCESLTLAGYADWRMPNTKELERVVDLEAGNPAVDTSYFPNTNNGFYWTSTSCSTCHKMKAFAIDFSDGELYYGNKFRNDVYDRHYVRAVRSADPDGDGVADPNDNCPGEYNPGQEDLDNDGIGSVCDDEEQQQQVCIATRLLGADSRYIDDLRQFRDDILDKSAAGKKLIAFYYDNGVCAAAVFKKYPLAETFLRCVLKPVAAALSIVINR